MALGIGAREGEVGEAIRHLLQFLPLPHLLARNEEAPRNPATNSADSEIPTKPLLRSSEGWLLQSDAASAVPAVAQEGGRSGGLLPSRAVGQRLGSLGGEGFHAFEFARSTCALLVL